MALVSTLEDLWAQMSLKGWGTFIWDDKYKEDEFFQNGLQTLNRTEIYF